MKKIFFFTAFFIIVLASYSQDIISMKRGARVNAIVTEITPTLVRYKLFSDPKGRVYFAYKDDVAGIMYQNGRVETFNQSDRQVVESKSTPIENQNQYQNQNRNEYQNQSQKPKQNQNQSHYQEEYQWSNSYTQPMEYYETSSKKKRTSFSQFRIGLAFPLGKFADGKKNDYEDYEYAADFIPKGKGFAAMGFTAGYKYYSPLSVKNLSLVFGIEALYNGLNSEAKDGLLDVHGWEDISYLRYLNFPLTLGLNYAYPIHESFKLYGELAIGGNLSIPTKMTSSYGDEHHGESETITLTPALGFTYGFETGFFINNKFSIGIRYNNLGSYKYKYKANYEAGYEFDEENANYDEESDTVSGKFKRAFPISNISLCLGILF